MPDFRLLVTGSREWDDEPTLRQALALAVTDHMPDVTVVVGDCPDGADAMTVKWCLDFGVRCEIHVADWEGACRASCKPGHRRRRRRGANMVSECPAAGPYRNQEAVDAGADAGLSFWKRGAGNRGTADCVCRAESAGIVVRPIISSE